MTNSDLKRRAERIGSLLDQVEDLKTEIKAAFEIAKSDGFNIAALRKAIAISRLDDKRRAKHDSAQSNVKYDGAQEAVAENKRMLEMFTTRLAELENDLFLYLEEIEGTAMREAAQ